MSRSSRSIRLFRVNCFIMQLFKLLICFVSLDYVVHQQMEQQENEELSLREVCHQLMKTFVLGQTDAEVNDVPVQFTKF